MHDDNCFITLTYGPDHLPADGSLNVEHWQKFAKRLRKRVGRFRFYHCGEYGDKFSRPHYHACLFGLDFDDKKYFKNHNGHNYYTSDLLDNIWGKGHCIVGNFTFETAAYVARYVTKKVTGDGAEKHYQGRRPEYSTQSRNPGIGAGWYLQFASDVWDGSVDDDFIVSRGVKCRPPRFYENIRKKQTATPSRLFPDGKSKEMTAVKIRRHASAKKHADDQTPARLKVRETVKRAQFAQLKRSYEQCD